MSGRRVLLAAAMLAALVVLACQPIEQRESALPRAGSGHQAAEGEDLAGEAGEAGAERRGGVSGPAAEPATPGAPLAAARFSEPVVGRTGPGGRPFATTNRAGADPSYLFRRMGGEAVGLALRATTLRQAPCSSCHTPGRAASPQAGGRRVHEDIPRAHPVASETACVSCHSPRSVDELVLFGGETAPLSQAYRLCGECHSVQAAAWAGGAHGKRLERWAGPRVVLNCPDCHDPHQPVTPRRVPYAGPQLPPKGGGHE